MAILDASDMVKRRTPSELLAWVEQQCDLLGSSPESKSYARSGARLPKKLYEEIRPLALFAWSEFDARPGVYVTPSVNNDNFDGRVDIPDGHLFVEITYAKDGYDESLRMEALEREGHVNALAPVTVSGTKRSPNRKVTVPSEAVNHADVVARNLRHIEQRLVAKSNTNYGPHHVLVVVVDDSIALRSDKDIGALKSFAERILPALKLDFGRVVFLGASGKVLLNLRGASAL